MDFLKNIDTAENPLQLALATEERQFTFSELRTAINRCKSVLEKSGLAPGTRILLSFENHCLHFICSMAALELGLCHLSLQTGIPEKRRLKAIENCDIKNAVSDHLSDLSISIHTLSFAAISQAEESVTNHSDTQKNELALLLLGSGTTGDAKILGISFSQLNKLIFRDTLARTMKPGESHLSFTPVEFYTAKRRQFSCLQQNACIVMGEYFNSDLLSLTKTYKVNHFSAAVNHGKELQTLFQQHVHFLKSLFQNTLTFFIGGSPVSITLRKVLNEITNNKVYVAYGSNEVGECCIASPETEAKYPGSIGKALPGVTLEIVDKNGGVKNTDEIGLVRITTDAIAQNINNHQAHKSEYSFYPNDIGRKNDEGIYFFYGRSDDCITYKGTQIFPREIESILENIHDIEELAAFPINIADDQLPALAFTAKTKFPVDEINAIYKEHLGWLAPRFIFQVEEMPKNPAGKILKRQLKEHFEKIVLEGIKKG